MTAAADKDTKLVRFGQHVSGDRNNKRGPVLRPERFLCFTEGDSGLLKLFEQCGMQQARHRLVKRLHLVRERRRLRGDAAMGDFGGAAYGCQTLGFRLCHRQLASAGIQITLAGV